MTGSEETQSVVPNPSGDVWSHHKRRLPAVKDGKLGKVSGSGKSKLAIVGFATSSRHMAPYDSLEYEVWALNQLYRHIFRADRWFDIHVNYNEHVVEGSDHVQWLSTCQIPVYMYEHWPQYPTSVRYPIEEVIHYFGGDYFTSTIAFMLALAIKEGFKEIEIYGVDLIVGTEWEEQRQCVEYYIGWARGMGIKITIPRQSALLSQRYRYGYATKPTDLISFEDFAIRSARIRERRDKCQLDLAVLDGALQENDHWHHVYTSTDGFRPRAFAIKTKRDELQSALILLDGALQEDEHWANMYRLRERGGEAKSSE